MKNQKGVTLIALIITIIVMLILVVVTINIATSGGIVNKAGEAKTQTQAATQNELNQMNTVANGIDVAVAGNTSWSGFVGNIIQPNPIHIYQNGVNETNIYINPEPRQPDELFAELSAGLENPIVNVQGTFSNEITKQIIYVEISSTQNESGIEGNSSHIPYVPQRVVIAKQSWSSENIMNLEYYFRLWENYTTNIFEPQSIDAITYPTGWSKLIATVDFTEDPDGVVTVQSLVPIQGNEIPVFSDLGEISIDENGEISGYFINPTTYYQ